MIMVNMVKWVDEVISDAPYAITEEFMNKLLDEYRIDYIIHGDDPCLLLDGSDAYALAKKAGRYKQIKQTEGVSTTDMPWPYEDGGVTASLTWISHFLPTSQGLYNSPTARGRVQMHA